MNIQFINSGKDPSVNSGENPIQVRLPSATQEVQHVRPMIALCGLCGLRVDPTNCPTCFKSVETKSF